MALQLVKKFRDLASVEGNRSTIVREGCLSAVLPHLGSSDVNITMVALECIHFLSMCPDNKEQMKKEPNLLLLVQALKAHKSPAVVQLAEGTLENLKNQATTGALSPMTPLADCSNTTTPSSTGGSAKKRPRTITVYLPELTTEVQRKLLSSSLLEIKGVISFLIDMFARKAVIRAVIPSTQLVKSITESTSLKASLSQAMSPSKENVPSYLPDSDDEEEVDYSKSIARRGAPDIAQEEQQAAWGWGIGRIAKALWG